MEHVRTERRLRVSAAEAPRSGLQGGRISTQKQDPDPLCLDVEEQMEEKGEGR